MTTRVINQYSGKNFTLYHGDSTEVLKGLPENSIDLTITSVPFASMYVYQKSNRDVGNNKNSIELANHLSYIMDELHRVTVKGRMCCIHLAQENIFKWQAGYIGRYDFRGEIIRMMQEIGWIWTSEVSIDKCPQLKAIRTKSNTLTQKGVYKDMTIAAPCMLDYVLMFKKKGDNPKPVPALISPKYNQHDGWLTMDDWIEFAHGVWKWQEEGDLSNIPDNLPHDVWYGIKESDVLSLNGKQAYRLGKSEKDEKHICPLQNGVVKRLIDMYSNEGDVVCDIFSGHGTSPYWAVVKNRKGLGIELKESYFNLSKRMMDSAKIQSLKFDF